MNIPGTQQMPRPNDTQSPPSSSDVVIRPAVAHPLVAYVVPWLTIGWMFSLNWTNILNSTKEEAVTMALLIALPLFLSFVFWNFLMRLGSRPVPRQEIDTEKLRKIAKAIFLGWAAATVVEVIVSGGHPMLWLIMGTNRSYMDFGITSIHGFVHSMLLASSAMYGIVAAATGQKKYYLVPAWGIVWFIISITRAFVLIAIFQLLFIILQTRRINYAKIILYGLMLLVLIILGFGIIGDIRSPRFAEIAGITKEYPEWLPSGFIWMYIYLTTPIDNLVFTSKYVAPDYNPYFPLTLAQLLPTIIRGIVVSGSTTNGMLVTLFNVSTAYVMPYQDYGMLGMCIFAWVTMGAMVYFWRRGDILGVLGYSILAPCAISSIFSNMFFALPIAFQFFWFALTLSKSTMKEPVQAVAPAE